MFDEPLGFLWYMQVHLHVVHGSPEIFGVAESICSVRAGFSTGIIMGAQLTIGCVAAGTSLLWLLTHLGVASSLTLWRLPHWPWVAEGVL